jgi:outer membrane cobalamin receptor
MSVAIALALPLPATAAEVLQLPEVTVYGDQTPFSHLPQPSTVITGDEIRRSGAPSLAQLLKSQPGVAVRQYGPVGALATMSLRGALGAGVLVLRDGVKLNSPERGGVDLSTVSLVGIERVEILSGGASALYGAEAVGGVIHLISAKKPRNRIEAGLGHFGHRYVKAESGARWGDTSVLVGVNRLHADNDYLYAYRGAERPRANSQFEGTDLSLSGKTRLGAAFLDVGLTLTDQRKGVPGPINYPSPLASQGDRLIVGTAKWVQSWGDVAQTTALSHHHARLDFQDPRSLFQRAATSTLNATDVQTALEWGNETHALTAGLGVTRDAVDGQNFGAKDRWLGALFLHDEWTLDTRWALFGDVRFDYNPTFGAKPSPRLGATYKLDGASRLRATLGRAYRAPTFNDLYWPSASGAAGNADLLPETSTQLELGWDHQQGPWLLENTLFVQRGTQTILWKPGTAGVWSPINVGATDVRGLELKATYTLGPFKWTNAATGVAAIDLADQVGKTLLYRPDWVAHSALAYAPGPSWDLRLGWDYLGQRYTTAQNTEFLPPVGLLSARVSYAVFPGDWLTLQVDNLAAKDYALQPYYPMPGRQIIVSWSHDF